VGLRLEPGQSLADGDRGWIATGDETLADGSQHASVWSVDATGNGARLGCGPTLTPHSGGVITAAVASNAVYAVVEIAPDGIESDLYYPSYTLVRLDRAPAVPAAP
jgi:hypothetical protein